MQCGVSADNQPQAVPLNVGLCVLQQLLLCTFCVILYTNTIISVLVTLTYKKYTIYNAC